MKHTFKEWMTAVKPWSLPALTMPFIVSLAYLYWKGSYELTWNILYAFVPVAIMTAGLVGAAKTETDSRIPAYVYGFELLFPYVWVGICSIIGLLPLHTVIVFLTIAVAMGCATTMKKSIGQGARLMKDLDVRTSRLQMMFSVLLSIALVTARFF